jgi:hypothetical protein
MHGENETSVDIPAPDLPVSENTFEGIVGERVHASQARLSIIIQAVCNESLLFCGKELSIFRPIDDDEE